MHTLPDRHAEYNQFVLEQLTGIETTHIASIVSPEYVFDFLVLYESLVESWTFYPFCLHAFVGGPQEEGVIASLGLPHVEVHVLPGAEGDWWANAGQKIRLIELSGLDRCIVSDVDNVFVAETPELFMLLGDADLVFIGSPQSEWIIQTSLWSFRRSEQTLRFATRWHEESRDRRHADASGLPFALAANDDAGLKVKVLARPKPASSRHHHPSPYDVQANLRPFSLTKDPLGLGFREHEMGRAKVIHLGGLHQKGRTGAPATLRDRLDTVIERYPESCQFFSLYATLAKRAAQRLGMEVEATPSAYLDQRLMQAEFPRRRDELPMLLNRRGLLGRGVEVGVSGGRYSGVLLRRWRGSHLLSVDPWRAASFERYPDVSNAAQEIQDRRYQATQERLARFGERSTIWRRTSEEAAARIDDRSLDFVYLDARHDYQSVKRDIELWQGKVRPGGILAGHDYLDGDLPEGVFGVQSAVNEAFEARVRTTALDGPWVSWFVDIPAPA